MKKIVSLIVGLVITLVTFTISAQQPKFTDVYPYIENTAVFEINQTEGHTVSIPFTSSEIEVRKCAFVEWQVEIPFCQYARRDTQRLFYIKF
jgi:hypothetical protein